MTDDQAPTTVRELLVERLGVVEDAGGDPEALADVIVRDLRALLSTGDQWVTRSTPVAQVAVGDTVRAKDGRLFMVEGSFPEDGQHDLVLSRPGIDAVAKAFAPDATVDVLLTRTDERALAVLERELNGEVIAREVTR